MTTYSLNMITYLKNKGIEVEVKTDNGCSFYGEFEATQEALSTVDAYKKDKDLHSFLHAYNDLRKEINTMRASIN